MSTMACCSVSAASARPAGRRVAVLAVLALATAAAACASRVQHPDVRLTGVRLASLGVRGGVVDVELEVHNPNRFAVRAAGLTYDLDFEDTSAGGWLDVAEGRAERNLRVGGGETVSVVIPVEFDYGGLGGAIRELLARGQFDYRVSGTVAVESPVARDFEYRQRGTVTPRGVRR